MNLELPVTNSIGATSGIIPHVHYTEEQYVPI